MPELEDMVKRQQVLAAFGQFAIKSDNLDSVLIEACRFVGEATGTGRQKSSFSNKSIGKTMVKILLLAAAIFASSAIAACRDTPDVQLQKMLAGRVAGRPVNCISLSGSNSSQIIDGKAIVYRVGSRLYVNEPRSGAESLHRDDILVTRTTGSQLCSIDTVRLIDRGSRFPRGFVSLGQFVPYSKIEAR